MLLPAVGVLATEGDPRGLLVRWHWRAGAAKFQFVRPQPRATHTSRSPHDGKCRGGGEALNRPFLDLDAIARWQGSPPWRTCLVATEGLRVVLFHWPAGFATVPHVHAAADEVFQVLRGMAVFAIGNVPEREVGPGEFILARRGVKHSISVSGNDPLTLLATVAPNDDRPDETSEPA